MTFSYLFLSTSKASNPQNHQKTNGFCMFLHFRQLLTIDSLIFETCLKKSSFWHPSSPKIHLQTHKVYQFVDDYFFSQLLFDLEGLWGGVGELSGGSQTHFWTQNGGAPPGSPRSESDFPASGSSPPLQCPSLIPK